MNHFGYTKEKWDALKAEARDLLIATAERRGIITYSDLCAKMTGDALMPHDRRLWEIIGAVSRDEEAAGRGLLSVLVIHKHGDQEPGGEFFELAASYGRDVRDQTKMFVKEVKRVHYYWSVTAKQKEERA